MKILLLNLPFIFEKKSDVVLSHCLGILQIASYLREHHCSVSILDALQEGYDISEKYNNYYRIGLKDEDIIENISPELDLIGISIPFSHLAKLAHDLIDKIKSKIPPYSNSFRWSISEFSAQTSNRLKRRLYNFR